MINIITSVKPFSFNISDRVYDLDFVYRVIAIDGVSGKGKTLLAEDLYSKQRLIKQKTGFDVIYRDCATHQSEIVDLLNRETNFYNNKIIILDNIEMVDREMLKNAIVKTLKLNTQWIQIGHGNYQCLSTVNALRTVKVKLMNKGKENQVFKIELKALL